MPTLFWVFGIARRRFISIGWSLTPAIERNESLLLILFLGWGFTASLPLFFFFSTFEVFQTSKVFSPWSVSPQTTNFPAPQHLQFRGPIIGFLPRFVSSRTAIPRPHFRFFSDKFSTSPRHSHPFSHHTPAPRRINFSLYSQLDPPEIAALIGTVASGSLILANKSTYAHQWTNKVNWSSP
jgi:hypothetical protein